MKIRNALYLFLFISLAGWAIYALRDASFQVVLYKVWSFSQADPQLSRGWIIFSVPILTYLTLIIFQCLYRNTPRNTLCTVLSLLCFSLSALFSHFLSGVLFSAAIGLSSYAIWHHISALELSPNRLKAIVALIFTLLFTALFTYQWEQFQLGRIGLPEFWNMYPRLRSVATGEGFLSSHYAPMFFDHFQPGLALWAPLNIIWPHVSVMFFIQAISLASTVLAVYWVGLKMQIDRVSIGLLCMLIALYPGISQMSYNFSYGFHPASTALPFLILSTWFWHNNQKTLFFISACIACSMKETHATYYIAMGAVEFIVSLKHKNSLKGPILLTTLSSIYLIGIMKFLLPQFSSDDQYLQLTRFTEFGDSLGDIILSVLTKPSFVLSHIFNIEVFSYLVLVIGGLGFLPLLRVRYLLYGALSFFGTTLMNYDNMLNIAFQYQVDLLAAATTAVLFWCRDSTKNNAEAASQRILLSCVMGVFCLCSFYGLLPFSRNTMSYAIQGKPKQLSIQNATLAHDIADHLPRDLKILSTDRLGTIYLDWQDYHPLCFNTVPLSSKAPDVLILDPNDRNWSHGYKKVKNAITWAAASNQYKLIMMPWMKPGQLHVFVFIKKTTTIPQLEQWLKSNDGKFVH